MSQVYRYFAGWYLKFEKSDFSILISHIDFCIMSKKINSWADFFQKLFKKTLDLKL